MAKKITIIGAGTAGCLTASSFLNEVNKYDIELIYDPNIPPAAVGEATNYSVANFLSVVYNFNEADLIKCKGTKKFGIQKNNWGPKDYFHPFLFANYAFHLDSKEFQKLILSKLSKVITVKEQSIDNIKDIKSDYIIDCRGKYEDSEVNFIDSIPVNASYVTQCFWDKPEFEHTLTIARPYGWVFGVPLQDRCSIGYLFNSSINNVEEVKEDVKEVFKEFNLNPSEKTNLINFKSYYRKNNFNGNVFYNGNASFFTEPLEATTFEMQVTTAFMIKEAINTGTIGNKQFQTHWEEDIKKQIVMINLHYLNNKNYNTDFWKEASKNANNLIRDVALDEEFRAVISSSFIYDDYINKQKAPKVGYGTWPTSSFALNVKALGIKNELEKYLKLW